MSSSVRIFEGILDIEDLNISDITMRKLDLDYKKRVNEKATGANLNVIFCVFINTILLKIQCQTYSILRFKKKSTFACEIAEPNWL
jgi:hypothetical protein